MSDDVNVKELLSLCGLDPDDTLVEVESLESPADTQARGLVVESMSSGPITTMDPTAVVPSEQVTELPFQIFATKMDRGVFLVEPTDQVQIHRHRGRIWPVKTGWELDGREGRCTARVEADEGDYVLDLIPPELKVYVVERLKPALTEALDISSLNSERESLPDLDVHEALSALAPSRWLLETADSLVASPSALDRVSGAGTLLRLWRPEDAALRDRVVADMVAGGPDPVEEALKPWASQVPGTAWLEVEDDAILEVDDLAESLEGLVSVASEDHSSAGAMARDIVWRRERLEGALVGLRLGDAGQQLSGSLESLDRLAVTEMSLLSSVMPPTPPFCDEHLDELAQMEPDAWWHIFWTTRSSW